MATLRKCGPRIVRLVRTLRKETGVRGVLYLPDGDSVHTLEDNPIESGTYFLSPDHSGKHRNWVIERILGSRIANDDRVDVEVHAGNLLSDSDACILPGLGTSAAGVLSSKLAIQKMRKVLERDASSPKTWVFVISEAV